MSNNRKILYFTLNSPYNGDETKNCALLGAEIDNNFFYLRGADVESVRLERTEDGQSIKLFLTLVNGEVIESEPILDQQSFRYDAVNGLLVVTFPDGTEQELPIGQTFICYTSEGIKGKGTAGNPLRLSEAEKTGQYGPVEKVVHIEDNVMPDGSEFGKGYRILTEEITSDNYGFLYDYRGVKALSERLETDGSEWRVPTKEDWDELLNAIEYDADPCDEEIRNHDNLGNGIFGKFAGKKLKDVGFLNWARRTAENVGEDAYGFKALPLGYGDERAVSLSDTDMDIEGFHKCTGFWTSSKVNLFTEGEGNDAYYAKVIDNKRNGVRQLAMAKPSRLSIRLVKDFTGGNFSEFENILGRIYPTTHIKIVDLDQKVLHSKIWMTANIEINDGQYFGVVSPEWQTKWYGETLEADPHMSYLETDVLPNPNAQDAPRFVALINGENTRYFQLEWRKFHTRYFVNEWNGQEWIKKAMQIGDSIVIRNHTKDGEYVNRELHEWRLFRDIENNDYIVDVADVITDAIGDSIEALRQSLEAEKQERIVGDAEESGRRAAADEILTASINDHYARAIEFTEEQIALTEAKIAVHSVDETETNGISLKVDTGKQLSINVQKGEVSEDNDFFVTGDDVLKAIIEKSDKVSGDGITIDTVLEDGATKIFAITGVTGSLASQDDLTEEIGAREAAIAQEVADRVAAIEAERATSEAELAAEKQERIDGDNAVQEAMLAAIEAEAQVRQSADELERTERVAAVEAEAQARQDADELEKQERISAIEAERATSEAELATEKQERIDGDNAAQEAMLAAVEAEAQARQDADDLERAERIAAVEAEAQARQDADELERQERIAAIQSILSQKSVTYSELVALKGAKGLEAGMEYRVTDYITTTSQADTQALSHQFDLILTADSTDVLNEFVRVCEHDFPIGSAESLYFSNCNLNGWSAWYCLENDADRFGWADVVNGKGVIYRLIDDRGNDCPYDFKNIQFKGTDGNYHFTFGFSDDNSVVMLPGATFSRGNKIGRKFVSNTQVLNANYFGVSAISNVLGDNCEGNYFAAQSISNTLGNNCIGNEIGDYFGNDKFYTQNFFEGGVSYVSMKLGVDTVYPTRFGQNISIHTGVRGIIGSKKIINNTIVERGAEASIDIYGNASERIEI